METIGEAAQRALALPETGSSTPSANIAKPPAIVRPSTDQEANALIAWGSATDQTEPKASIEQIGRHLEFLAATLPTKRVDTATGKNRFAVYVSTLNGFSDQALIYMSRRICAEMDWFPTPHQCLTVLNDFQGDKLTRRLAVRYGQDHWQQRMEEFMTELDHGDTRQLADVPERWRSIAETRMLLRRLKDGSYELRPRKPGGDLGAETSGSSRARAQEDFDHG